MSQGALRDCWVGSLLPHELRDMPCQTGRGESAGG